ncbi:MAG: DUF1972 domain-containing protein [Nitrospirae bacterium]|nr:DUF1972 domain-containing protein [Nitrospirota bacterium]
MKIALIGTRGVPASYGGFETCAEEVGKRLVKRGHDVTVYCRKGYYAERLPAYMGMNLVYLPNLRFKSLDTISHTFLSVLHALGCGYDVLMVFNAANSPILLLPRILGNKIAINTDGLEWKRGKWGAVARRYYKFSEWFSTKVASRIIADSPGIRQYYRENYGAESSYIAYGAYISESRRPELLKPLGLEPGGYFLQITRFEPENNPLLTIRAFKKLTTDKKLVLVGGVPYRSDYSMQIASAAGGDVILPGFIYEKEVLNELWCNCYAYIHGNEVGGTNPALLQSMASSCFTIAIDVAFSRDVLRNSGVYYSKSVDSLAEKMKWALEHPAELSGYKKSAMELIRKYYSWDTITEQYETLFRELRDGQGI